MKTKLFAVLLAIVPLLFSCKKDMIVETETAAVKVTSTTTTPTSSARQRMNCEPFPFAILALNEGSLTSTNLNVTGSLGYSYMVSSANNTNLNVNGNCFVHTGVTNFLYSLGPLSAILGLQQNSYCDYKLDEANYFASEISTMYNALAPDITYNNIISNKTINSASALTGMPNTIVNLGRIELKDKSITLVGAPSSDDGFIINLTEGVILDNSEIKLINVRPERVLFNVFNSATVQIKNQSKFRGTILSPAGTVMCLNIHSLEGSIVAKNIFTISYAASLCSTATNSVFTQKTYCNGYQW